MHMADALVAPAVATTMYLCSAAAGGYSVRQVRALDEPKKVPVMGVMGAFVFATQMINFTIPGTGSSGHLCGGMLLSALLGPYAGFLTMIGRIGEFKALQRSVEERFVCRHGIGGKRLCIHGKAMVLARNVHVSCAQIHHRMVRAVVSELHFERFGADGKPHDLMAEADAEKRDLLRDDRSSGLDGICAG